MNLRHFEHLSPAGGEGLITHSPSGESATSVRLGSLLSRELEIEIERLTTRLMSRSSASRFDLVARQRHLLASSLLVARS